MFSSARKSYNVFMRRIRLRVRKCKSENLEVCESLWRHVIESSQVHECPVRVPLKA